TSYRAFLVLMPVIACRDDDQKRGLQQDRANAEPKRENRLGWHANFCHHVLMRVLIADDQKSVGTSLAEMVRRCQHEVVEVVGSGLEAIHAYDRHRPDVVLMDYQMP